VKTRALDLALTRAAVFWAYAMLLVIQMSPAPMSTALGPGVGVGVGVGAGLGVGVGAGVGVASDVRVDVGGDAALRKTRDAITTAMMSSMAVSLLAGVSLRSLDMAFPHHGRWCFLRLDFLFEPMPRSSTTSIDSTSIGLDIGAGPMSLVANAFWRDSAENVSRRRTPRRARAARPDVVRTRTDLPGRLGLALANLGWPPVVHRWSLLVARWPRAPDPLGLEP
jgi:hypothetical protein